MNRAFRTVPLVALFVTTTTMAALFGSLFAGTMPTDLGVRDARLNACPDRPNCVNSQATAAGHAIAPLAFKGNATAAMHTLAKIVAATPGGSIITERDGYLQATFATPTMGFVDDVEFLLDPQRNVIDVRSASRLGHSDLGVNRRRVETLRQALASALG